MRESHKSSPMALEKVQLRTNIKTTKTITWITSESKENMYRQSRRWQGQISRKTEENKQTSFINSSVHIQNNWRKVVALLTEPCGSNGHDDGSNDSGGDATATALVVVMAVSAIKSNNEHNALGSVKVQSFGISKPNWNWSTELNFLFYN